MNKETYWFFREDVYQMRNDENSVAFRFEKDSAKPPHLPFTEYLIRAGSSIEMNSKASIALIPLEGEFTLFVESDVPKTFYPGELITVVSNSEPIRIETSHEQEWSRLYVVELPIPLDNSSCSYQLEKNSLTRVSIHDDLNFLIGYFGNRIENEFQLEKHHVQIITIHGVFECQDRLLKEREILLIENTSHIGYESLLENTVILAFEF